MSTRKSAFSRIYATQYWGSENLSGAGSSIEATRLARQAIQRVVANYQIRSIVDVACGDFVWIPLVLEQLGPQVSYLGCDIVDSLISQHQQRYPQYSFQQLDFVENQIPSGDLILCREALQHLPVQDIKRALLNFSQSGAKYLLATIHLKRYGLRNYQNIKPGRCRDRNLLMPPFNLPNPLEIYAEEEGYKDKWLGLWRLPFNQSS
jgi:hypothetical protein